MPAADLATLLGRRRGGRGPTTEDWLAAARRDRRRAGGRVPARPRARAPRARRCAEAVTRGELSPETDTRLRFVRRLVYAVIILLGVAVALSQFGGINRLAASLLASGAIAAAILGFAARQTLANFVAGIMLAVTQPLRVGDWVFVEDQYGVVEDIRLNYTFLRTLGGQQIVIPNEKLASGILRNDTLGDGRRSRSTCTSGCRPTADAGRAVAALRGGDRADRDRGRDDGRGRPAGRRAASPSRRPSARRARPSCGCAASRGCAPRACSPTAE